MVRACFPLTALALAGTLFVAGCTDHSHEKPQPATPGAADKKEGKIQAALAKLEPADRKLAEAQKWCAVNNKSRLGTMGPPHKLMLKDQPVFLCCDGCKEDAEANPEKTLAKVAELKAKAAAETKTP